MESYQLLKFAVKREFEHEGATRQRFYQFEFQPYSPYEEIISSLDELRDAFIKAQEEALRRQEEEKAKAEAAQAPIEPELVS